MAQAEAPVSRPLRLFLALTALVLLIGGYLYLKSRPEEQEEPARTARISLIEHAAEDLRKIEAEPAEGERLAVMFLDDAWTMDVPWQKELDLTRLSRTATGIAALTADRLLDDAPRDLSIFGLDPPRLILRLVFADGKEELLEVGSPTPSGTERYLKLQGGKEVYTVQGRLIEPFFGSPLNFRNRFIAGINPQSITYLLVATPRERIELVPSESLGDTTQRSVMSALSMLDPYGPRGVDTRELEKLLGVLPRGFTITEFIDDTPANLADYGLENPAYHIELADEKRRIALDVGSRREGGSYNVRFGSETPIVAVAEKDLAFLNEADGFKLAEKFILIINIDKVDSVEIFYDDKTYTASIERSGTGDDTVETYFFENREIEEKKFKELYQSLIGIVADAPNRGEPDSGEDTLRVTYHLNSGPEEELSASFVPVDRDFFAAYREGESRFLVSAQQVMKVVFTLLDFL
jgi:Domain of unknown function (DUF4340)